MSHQRSNQPPPRQRQELVFCHQCENEWHNNGDPTGLTCPTCGSDFTEIIDNDFDPRAAQTASPPAQQNPFAGVNPWADVPDPDEEDIEGFGHHPQMYRRAGGGYVGDGHIGQRYQAGQPGMENPFYDMLQGIMGRAMGPPFGPGAFPPMPGQAGPQGQYGNPRGQAPFGQQQGHPFGQQEGGQHGQQQGQQYGQPGGFNTTYTRSGPGYTITVSNGPFFAMGSGRGPMGQGEGGGGMPPDMNEVLSGLFGSLGMPPGGPRAGAGHPFGAFASLFDPANARHGDAVFSQEAFDRVMSQLMEQNPHGSAPPPATEQAINNLPKKKLDVEQLDENTGQAECSICMENVDVGEEITVLPCKHWFHFECVKAWLTEHDTCPVCRSGIMPKDGGQNAPRTPGQQPRNQNEPGAYLSRQQSGSRQHPFIVEESPSRARRPPMQADQQHSRQGSGGSGGSSGGGGITDRIRDWWNNSGNDH